MSGRIAALTAVFSLVLAGSASASITFPDFSNNDPCYCAAALKAHGHAGEIDKVNQGVGFIDRTFSRMAADAKAHGLSVGGYDFDQEYTAREAYTFVERLKASGITRSATRTFPPTLDVEFGVPSRAGLEHQLAVLFRVYGRAQIYTGAWYWLPHFGCWIPPKVTFWLSGYPTASILCGLPESRWVAHQYTDHGFNGAFSSDMSRWLGSTAGFKGFVQAKSKQITAAQVKAAKTASLHAHERERRELHGDIERHQCRKGQHVIPRLPLRTRRHLHNDLCPRWIKRGAADIKVIHRYRREGIKP